MLKKMVILTLTFFTYSLQGWINIETLQGLTGMKREILTNAMRKLDNIEKEAESGWKSYYHIFPNIINTFDLKKGCEIGVSTGGHSYEILKITKVEKLYSIDPHCRNATLNLGDHYLYDILHYRVKYRLSQFGERSELIRAYSSNVVNRFKNNELDFVFVDGSHEYKDVKQDLNLYFEKIRPGGIMGGDDYNTGFPGVPRAVNEFFGQKNIQINIDPEQPRIWWVQKPTK